MPDAKGTLLVDHVIGEVTVRIGLEIEIPRSFFLVGSTGLHASHMLDQVGNKSRSLSARIGTLHDLVNLVGDANYFQKADTCRNKPADRIIDLDADERD